MTVRTVDTSLNRALSLNTWCCDLAGILDQFIRSLLFNVEDYFLYPSFVGISEWIPWQSVCFRCFIWHHAWFSRADLDDLCDRSQSFLVRQLLAINNLTVRAIDASFDRALTLNTWCCDLTSILDQFIRSLLFNVEGYFLYTNFVGISQRILWQCVCLRWIVRYHGWLSRSDFDNLCYRSQGFFIRKFLTVNLLTVRTIDTSLNGTFALDSWSCDLTGILNKLIRFFFTNAKVNFLNPSFVGIS